MQWEQYGTVVPKRLLTSSCDHSNGLVVDRFIFEKNKYHLRTNPQCLLKLWHSTTNPLSCISLPWYFISKPVYKLSSQYLWISIERESEASLLTNWTTPMTSSRQTRKTFSLVTTFYWHWRHKFIKILFLNE